MNATEALGVFHAAMPETGAVPYQDVYDALQATAEGRKALTRFHDLRRDKDTPLYAGRVTINGERVFVVSREPLNQEGS